MFHTRPARTDDRTYLARLYFLTNVWGDETREVSKDLADETSYFAHEWQPDWGGVVAFDEHGIPAGGCWLVEPGPFAEPLIDDGRKELVIAVERRFQGQGLARRLITEVLAIDSHIYLYVELGNDRARRIYEQAGFTEVGPSRNYTVMRYEGAISAR